MKNNRTAKACIRDSCDGCEIEGQLICVHTFKDKVDFVVLYLNQAIPFFIGMISGKHWIGLAVWGGLAIIFFGYVEQKILCSHCPHYLEDGFFLKCFGNSGLPKIPKFNPNPINKIEKTIWFIYVLVLFLWHIPFFIIGEQWLLLIWTTWALILATWILQRNQCTRCYNLTCPLNRTPSNVREGFYQNYSQFAKTLDSKKNDGG